MAERKTTTAVDDWKDVPADDWKDVTPSTPTETQEKPWIGQPRPENEGTLSRIFHAPAYGVQDIGTGVQHMMQPGKRMQGAHEILSGAGEAGLPFIVPAAVAAPAATALGLAGGTLGAGAGRTAAEIAGASPEATNLAGDVGGIAGGFGAARYGPGIAESAMERVPHGFGMNPDVRAGAGKIALGYGMSEMAPGPLKWPVRALTMWPGIRQVSRGILKPDAAAEQAVGELPTIKPPAQQGAPPAVFGDPEGFAKLPASVQEAILRGQATVNAPAASKPLPGPLNEPIDIGEPQRSLQPSAPMVPPVERPATVDISGTLDKMKAEQGITPGKHLGEVPRGSYPERWDEGAPTPTVRSTMSKTKYIRVNPEDVGVHGGVENTPIKGPLNTPEKLKIARDLANELKKSSKGGK